MSDKAAARQYAVRNKKIFNMRNPEYIPEPTGASNTSTQHMRPFIGQSDDKAATSIGKSEETATFIGKSDDTVKTSIGKSNPEPTGASKNSTGGVNSFFLLFQ